VSRPLSKHIDNAELDALMPTVPEMAPTLDGSSLDVTREIRQHVAACQECREKVQQYLFLVSPQPTEVRPAAARGPDCPEDIDWYDVVLGLWPEFKATQLLAHAAVCDHCGPRLRAATRLEGDPTPWEESFLAELRAPSNPVPGANAFWRLPRLQSLKGLTAALALVLIAGALTVRSSLLPPHLSGQEFVEFAVASHRQHAQGRLALDVRSDSQQALNEWFKAKSPFSLALPARSPLAAEQRPYRLEGARLVPVKAKTAVFIAYQLQTSTLQTTAASLTVIPDSVAVASGGTEAGFKKVTFHYSTAEGYKVVTWSLHGLTYALVSSEGNKTQRSCMVCHSALGDRDLSGTATPLPITPNPLDPFLQ